MLEHAALLLRPCTAPPDGAPEGVRPARAVLDARTGAALGVAGWRAEGRRWLRWLGRPVLAVHESDDAPLVFTARRLWGLGPRWEVCDADGHVVGRLYGPLLKDRFGRTLAAAERGPAGALRVRDAHGRELMVTAPGPGGVRVSFGPEAEGNPFFKMLLLAAALVM
jgi:hypothetical protein